MYNSVNIANYFIEKSFYDGIEITPMKVLKLVYISHGWHLGLFEEPLITEQTEAWKFGPVVPSVYHAYKQYGSGDIHQINDGWMLTQEYERLKSNPLKIEFLDRIWEVYKNFTGLQLSDLTHQENTPWHETWIKNKGSLKKGAIIPNKLIEQYYKNK